MVRPASRSNLTAGPSEVRVVNGSQPGALDPTQPSRLLRTPDSTLTFAYFNPYAATPLDISRIGNLSLNDERCRPKRIVLETIPGQPVSWRWVPSALKQEGVEDEGIFPRLIDLCGQLCEISQDQWDFYKLDPLYNCFVKFPPALTVITRRAWATHDRIPSPAADSQSTKSEYTTAEDGYDSDRMVVDDDSMPVHPKAGSSPHRKRKQSPRVALDFNFGAPHSEQPPDPKPKRKAHVCFQTLRPNDEEDKAYLEQDGLNRNTKFYTPRNQKRTRTLSPGAQKRTLQANRTARDNSKKTRWEQEKEARRELRERAFLLEVLTGVPPAYANFNGNGHTPGMHDIPDETDTPEEGMEQPPVPESTTQEEAPEDPIADSLRKMAELNADRERQREREKHLRGEEVKRRAQSEDPSHEQQKRQKLTEENRKKEEETRRREELERAMLEDEKRRRRRVELLERLGRERELRHEQWNSGYWSHHRAVERYKGVSAFFDKARFSGETFPLAFLDIPWPTLKDPRHNNVQDLDWDAVNDFFSHFRQNSRPQEYKDILRVSFQRFHPDRWDSRNLFTSILDEQERNEVHTAVSMVSKAIGALYTEVKGT